MSDQPDTPDGDIEPDEERQSSRTGGDAEAAGSIEEREDVAEELAENDGAQGDDSSG
jgi:hypothetical protein